MSEDTKEYQFISKNDLVIYLSLTLELSCRHFDRYKKYLKEFEEFILNNDKIEYEKYKELEDMLYTPKHFLLNLFGDRSKKSTSYFRIRKEMKCKAEEFGFDYVEHSEEVLEIFNKIYKIRNYEHHFTDSKIIEWRDYRLNQIESGMNVVWPNSSIEITYYKYLDRSIIIKNLEEMISQKNDFEKLLQLMKKDYSYLIGKKMSVKRVYQERTLPNHNLIISKNGIDRHLGKKK